MLVAIQAVLFSKDLPFGSGIGQLRLFYARFCWCFSFPFLLTYPIFFGTCIVLTHLSHSSLHFPVSPSVEPKVHFEESAAATLSLSLVEEEFAAEESPVFGHLLKHYALLYPHLLEERGPVETKSVIFRYFGSH